MSPSEQQLLAQLRDVHLPDEPSFWPPSTALWLLCTSVLLLLALLALWWHQRIERRRPVRGAQAQLQRLQRRATGSALERTVLMQDLSVLLRRVVLSHQPRDQIAPLSGELWLHCLDRILGERQFSRGPGRVFAQGPFQRPGQVSESEVREALSLVGRVIQRLESPHRA